MHRRLHDLAYQTNRTLGDLLLDATLLLLRYHGRGHDLPEPTPPVALVVNPDKKEP
jgi:hypothetical protein